jgi:ubiquinol-cytochrome c reductase cytochrome b subunit
MTVNRRDGAPRRAVRLLGALDQRYHAAAGVRRRLTGVVPTHWSFLLAQIALYSFVVLLVSGVYLALFFDPSMQGVTYVGVFDNLRGLHVSRAYESVLNLSFEVRGGLFVRQVHHWASLVFVAALLAHLARIFFTGAFRKPRAATWVVGVLLLLVALLVGFVGYSLPDDLLSGTGLRVASGFVLSVPVVGTWAHWALFGGEFPGTEIIPRLYVLHVLLLPAVLLALGAVYVGLVRRVGPTQFPGTTVTRRRTVEHTERNVVGVRTVPAFVTRTVALASVVGGVLALMGGLLQINPVWNYGPYDAAYVSSDSQPDWYLLIAEGMLRIFPAWELHVGGHDVPAVFWAGPVFLPTLFVLAGVHPWVERRLTRDDAPHHLLQRPRDAPVRTALGAMAFTFSAVLVLCGADDLIARYFALSLDALVWTGRIGVLVLPPIAYWFALRVCLGLQRSDRAVLEHGVETGIIRRLPHGGFVEVRQPLNGVDQDGRAVPLEYRGSAVPKRMNQLGMSGAPVRGSFLTPDPPAETALLAEAGTGWTGTEDR